MKDLTLSRNQEFLHRCIAVFNEQSAKGTPPTIDSVIDKVLAMQPRSHYVNYDAASRRLHAIERHGIEKIVATAMARQMWTEIRGQIDEVMKRPNCRSFEKALSFVLNFCRPSRFYISKDTARRIVAPYLHLTLTRNRC